MLLIWHFTTLQIPFTTKVASFSQVADHIFSTVFASSAIALDRSVRVVLFKECGYFLGYGYAGIVSGKGGGKEYL